MEPCSGLEHPLALYATMKATLCASGSENSRIHVSTGIWSIFVTFNSSLKAEVENISANDTINIRFSSLSAAEDELLTSELLGVVVDVVVFSLGALVVLGVVLFFFVCLWGFLFLAFFYFDLLDFTMLEGMETIEK